MANIEQPIGTVEELAGSASILRADGAVEIPTVGSFVYQGHSLR